MFKKIFWYFKYRKIINQNLQTITQRYRFKYDRKYGRLYTILSIPENIQEVFRNYKIPSNLQNPIDTDAKKYLDTEINNYINSISEYFFSIGLFELISLSKKDYIDDVNVLLVLRYKFKNHQLFLYLFLGTFVLILSSVLIAGFVKFLIFLINFIISL